MNKLPIKLSIFNPGIFNNNELVFEQSGLSVKLIKLESPLEGQAEIHRYFHDIYLVVQGEATVVTGEALTESIEIRPGEYRGNAIVSPIKYEIKKGDVFIIPAGVAHQVSIQVGKLVQWVMKCSTSSE